MTAETPIPDNTAIGSHSQLAVGKPSVEERLQERNLREVVVVDAGRVSCHAFYHCAPLMRSFPITKLDYIQSPHLLDVHPRAVGNRIVVELSRSPFLPQLIANNLNRSRR